MLSLTVFVEHQWICKWIHLSFNNFKPNICTVKKLFLWQVCGLCIGPVAQMVEHPSCKREVVGSYPTRHGAGPWIFRFISQWAVTSVRLPACMLGWPSSPPTRLIKRSTPSAHTLGAEFAHMWTACTVYSTFTTMCPPPHPTFSEIFMCWLSDIIRNTRKYLEIGEEFCQIVNFNHVPKIRFSLKSQRS